MTFFREDSSFFSRISRS